MSGRIDREKGIKLVSWDKGRFMGRKEKKTPQVIQEQPFTTSHKPSSAQTLSEWWLPWKIPTLCYHSFMAEHDITQSICYHICSVCVSLSVYVHSQSLVQIPCRSLADHSSPTSLAGQGMGGVEKKRKSQCCASTCSAIAKMPASYKHCFSHKSRTRHHTGCYEES